MGAKAVRSYSDSAELKNTLAMANLTERYLNQGFTEHAQTQIDHANRLAAEGVAVHGNIGLSKNRLDKILSDEDEKERELLAQATLQNDFFLEYFRFSCEGRTKPSIFEGNWKTPWGVVPLHVNDTTGSVSAKVWLSVPPSQLAAAGVSGSTPQSESNVRSLAVEGWSLPLA
jgi:hypothetical protein